MRRAGVVRASMVAGILAFTVCFFAQDAQAGWFVGGSVGQSKVYDYSVGGPIDEEDDTDFAYRIGGGYTFIKYFGLAGSYVDLGDANFAGPAFGGFTDTLSVDGFDFSMLGALPVHDRVALIGTIGLFSWNQKVDYRDPSGHYPYDESGSDLSYGAGVRVSVGAGDVMGVHLSWQRFTDVGDPDESGHSYDWDFIAVGFGYSFP